MVPYAEVDLLYGWKALEEGDGFTNAQGECQQKDYGPTTVH
jgi:hypothetical protein